MGPNLDRIDRVPPPTLDLSDLLYPCNSPAQTCSMAPYYSQNKYHWVNLGTEAFCKLSPVYFRDLSLSFYTLPRRPFLPALLAQIVRASPSSLVCQHHNSFLPMPSSNVALYYNLLYMRLSHLKFMYWSPTKWLGLLLGFGTTAHNLWKPISP